MKKYILIFTCLFLLFGCSSIENMKERYKILNNDYDIEETAKEKAPEVIDKVKEQTNSDNKTLEELKETPGVVVVEAKPEDPNNPTPNYTDKDIKEIEDRINSLEDEGIKQQKLSQLNFIKTINCPRLRNQQLKELVDSME